MMKFGVSIVTVVAAAATLLGGTSAFVPTHLEYLTDAEMETASQLAEDGYVLRRRQLEETDDVSMGDGDVSSETEDLFAAAAGEGGEDDDSMDADGLTFDPPIAFGQYSSDTCAEDTLLYAGAITGIVTLEEGVFCVTDTIDLGDGSEPTMMYNKQTNVNCTIFGVTDLFESCSDADCTDCDGEETYMGLTEWDQVFPAEFDDHCFQQVFATQDEDGTGLSFDKPFNVDYQFATASSAAALEYKKYIAVHSCISEFVSSDEVSFTSDSITVTDEDGGSMTLTEDSLMLTDEDGGSVEIVGGTDGQGSDVTLTNAAGEETTIEDADFDMTDDGGMVIENDEQVVVVDAEGDFAVFTEDSITYGNDVAYIFVEENFVQMGSMTDLGSFNLTDNVDVELTDEMNIVISTCYDEDCTSTGSTEFGDSYVTIYFDGDEVVNITNVEYNFTNNLNDFMVPAGSDYDTGTEGIPFFIVLGEIEGVCDTLFLAITEGAIVTASPDCSFLSAMTDDALLLVTDDMIYGENEDGSVVITDDAFVVTDADGNEVIDATVEETDDALLIESDDFLAAVTDDALLVMTDDMVFGANEDGSVTITDDAFVVTDADGNEVIDATVEETDDALLIESDDFLAAVTDDELLVTTDDMLFAANADGEVMIVTDDFVSFGDEDVFVVFMEDSVMFGSSLTGENFTVDGEVDFDEESGDIIVTQGTGSMIFTADDTVVFTGPDGDATVENPSYNFTMDAFVITGDLDGCDDFFVAFNTDGVITGSEECEFLVIIGAGGDDDDATSDDDATCMSLSEWCDMGAPTDTDDTFNIFCGLLAQVDPDGDFDEMVITVFIPTDAAFMTLYGVLETVGMEVDDETIAEIVGFHIAEGQILSGDLECGGLIEMMAGGFSRTKCGNKDDGSGIIYYIQKGGGNRKNDMNPFIIGADNYNDNPECNQSVAHFIDQVMLPNSIPALGDSELSN